MQIHITREWEYLPAIIERKSLIKKQIRVKMGRGHTLLTRVEMGTYKIHAILNKFQIFSIFCTLLNFLQTFKGLYID